MDGSCDREMLLQWNPDTTILDITRGGFRGGGGGGARGPRPPLSVRRRFIFCQNIQ